MHSKTRRGTEALSKKPSVSNGSIDRLGLVGLGPVFDLLSLALWSGQVIGERPLSVLIVAPIGSGKTSLLEKLECEQAHYTSDITSRELSKIMGKPRVTHVLLGDLLSLFGHKSHVVSLTCRSLSTLTGEMAKTDSFTGADINGRMVGLISAIPPDDIIRRDIRNKLDEGGLYTRFIFARYRYTPRTLLAIHNYIKSDAYTEAKPWRFQIESEPARVSISPEIANVLRESAIGITQAGDSLGTRPHHHIRALAKAAALSCGRRSVTMADVQRVVNHSNFFTPEGMEL